MTNIIAERVLGPSVLQMDKEFRSRTCYGVGVITRTGAIAPNQDFCVYPLKHGQTGLSHGRRGTFRALPCRVEE